MWHFGQPRIGDMPGVCIDNANKSSKRLSSRDPGRNPSSTAYRTAQSITKKLRMPSLIYSLTPKRKFVQSLRDTSFKGHFKILPRATSISAISAQYLFRRSYKLLVDRFLREELALRLRFLSHLFIHECNGFL